MQEKLRIKRAYEAPGAADGARVLVDRLWPRGIAKEKARITAWMKDLSPSDELRRWFGHDPAKWPEFQRRYHRELDAQAGVTAPLAALLRQGPVTLVYAAKDEAHNNAVSLRNYLVR